MGCGWSQGHHGARLCSSSSPAATSEHSNQDLAFNRNNIQLFLSSYISSCLFFFSNDIVAKDA